MIDSDKARADSNKKSTKTRACFAVGPAITIVRVYKRSKITPVMDLVAILGDVSF